MKKRTYIQPEMEVVSVATSAMMDGNALSGGQFPSFYPGNPTTNTGGGAPGRKRTPVF